MAVKAIAYSYWRRIQAGARTFDSVPVSVQCDVRTLAQQDVEAGRITPEQYENMLCEPYSPAVPGE